MQGGTEPAPPVFRRIADLRQVCEREIREERQRAEDAAGAAQQALLSIRTKAEENIANRENLANTKSYLKELEDDLREALIVKSCKEAKHVATSASLSSAKARTEEFRETLETQRSRKAEYESIISLALKELKKDDSKDDVNSEGTEEAILWYKKVLGFRTEGGEGVKFIFDKIDSVNLDKEYSFTIRLNGDTYTLLQCDPTVPDVKLLLNELNQTNGLFKFVRAMRKRFQAAAEKSMLLPAHSEMSTASVSSPPPASADNSRSNSSSLNNNSGVSSRQKRYSSPKEVTRVYPTRQASQLQLINSVRRSPRQKVNQRQ